MSSLLTLLLLEDSVVKAGFREDESRGEHGRWSSSGEGIRSPPKGSFEREPYPRGISLWAVHPTAGVVFRSRAPNTILSHVYWFDSMGLPSHGTGYDRIKRGVVSVNPDLKIIHLLSYGGHAPREVYQKIKSGYRKDFTVDERTEQM